MHTPNLRDLAALAVLLLCGGALLFLFFRYLFLPRMPFLIAWALALLVRPPAHRLAPRLRIPETVLRVGMTLILFSLLFCGISLLVWRLWTEVSELITYLSHNPGVISGIFERLEGVLHVFSGTGEGGEASVIGGYVEQVLSESISALATAIPRLVGAAALRLPFFLLAVLITVIAAVYFTAGCDRIHAALSSLLPDPVNRFLRQAADGFRRTALLYLRSYFTLMLITFLELLTGFLILRIPYALLLAFLFSLIDILPVLGVGTMLVPWSAFCFLTGDIRLGTSLLILYGVTLIVRQLAEPRIIGAHLGVHPLLALILLYVGLRLFGVAGMLLAPFGALLLTSLYKKYRRADNAPHG